MSRELVERARQGDHEAFAALAAGVFDRLGAVARRILHEPEAADDAVQEALIRAWRQLRGLRDPERFEAWVYRLLVNACRDADRRRRRHSAEVTLLPIVAADSRDAVSDLADRDALERAFGRLTLEHRTVLVLTYYAGLRPPEIAAVLAIPIGTVHSRTHHALAGLRAALESDGRPVVRVTERPLA